MCKWEFEGGGDVQAPNSVGNQVFKVIKTGTLSNEVLTSCTFKRAWALDN